MKKKITGENIILCFKMSLGGDFSAKIQRCRLSIGNGGTSGFFAEGHKLATPSGKPSDIYKWPRHRPGEMGMNYMYF